MDTHVLGVQPQVCEGADVLGELIRNLGFRAVGGCGGNLAKLGPPFPVTRQQSPTDAHEQQPDCRQHQPDRREIVHPEPLAQRVLTHLPEMMSVLGLLPLAERPVKMGNRRRRLLPILILIAAMALVAAGKAPVAGAFFGAAVLMVVVGALSIREAYASLEPEVLVLIGALTPLSEAVQHSGGTGLIAHGLVGLLTGVPALLTLGMIMVAAMACSPFLHNAPTVLVPGPIGVGVARGLGLGPDAILMAVATGAGCDFLTSIGQQCNTLVMDPGGYRFGDYWRLGLPLSIIVILIGTPMIAWVWPLATR